MVEKTVKMFHPGESKMYLSALKKNTLIQESTFIVHSYFFVLKKTVKSIHCKYTN